jgi:hypothetical protein
MNRTASKLSQAVRVTLTLGLFFIVLTLRGAVSASAQGETGAQPNTTTSNLMIPFQGTVYVNTGEQSEAVDLAGSIHLVVQVFSPTDPCASCVPPNPIRIHTNMISVSGVGQTTGWRYEARGTANFELDVEVPSSFSVDTTYRLTPSPPPIRALPNPPPILPVRYFISLNADGEVTAATAGVGGGGGDIGLD